jgi:serine/threonine protein kinase
MQYVDGGTLENRLTGRPMDWLRVVALVIPVCEALHYAHQHGIIHRDVKPSNILMPQEDWPVLADFGLVKRSNEEKGLTLSGTFLGTPSYIAPEQARDLSIDARADMYALGVIMFQMITGKLPFDYETPNRILLAHVMDLPPNPRDLNPACPPELAEIILKTLSKSPDDRYADMQELVVALKTVATPVQLETSTESASPTKLTADLAVPASEVPEISGGAGGFFRRLFGRENTEAARDDGSITRPQEEIAIDNDGFDDEDDYTVNLDLNEITASAQLILVGKNATIALPNKPALVLGRTYGKSVADIDLEPYGASKSGVSRHHARLLRQGEEWLIEDLNSLNGTFVNDRQIKAGRLVKLRDGDRIRLSHLKLVIAFV